MLAGEPSAHAVGSLTEDTKESLAELVRHCMACRARRVLGVSMGRDQAAMAFEDAAWGKGIDGEILSVERSTGRPNPENVKQGGLRAMQSYLARTSRLPDLIYFSDDYFARGGLTALAHADKRVPEDVQVVAHANRGNRIAYPQELTRMEVDPEAVGRAMADLVLGILGRSRGQRHVVLPGPRLVLGETTVPRNRRRP
jgi:DNA-binding LacI/PurR family transcriptional regulator